MSIKPDRVDFKLFKLKNLIDNQKIFFSLLSFLAKIVILGILAKIKV